ncbi:MAG: hypothetical protein KC503_04020, partial [Myxococcales bacterium]|nr:hypothetical protein [Myxococcales bacterium]
QVVDGGTPRRLVIHLGAEPHRVTAHATYRDARGKIKPYKGSRRLPTPLSPLPPLVAIALALSTRRVITSILLGTIVGAALTVGTAQADPGFAGWLWAIFKSPWEGIAGYLWAATSSTFTLYVLSFTFFLCGMVGIAGRAGGNQGLVNAIAGVATNARRTRLATCLMGMVIFFEDYANAIVVGQTARPLTDAKNISREKLAYLVDSTAAPVAGLALVSTWIGWEVGLFQGVADELGLVQRGYQIFLTALPMRFYCLLTLVFVFGSTLMRRDFGPMLTAERRAFHEGLLSRPGAKPLASGADDRLDPAPSAVPRWWLTGLPIIVLLSAVIIGMVVDGGRHHGMADVPFEWSWQYMRDAFSHGDNGPVLLYAGVIGTLLAALLARFSRAKEGKGPVLEVPDVGRAFFAGGWASVPALAILITAKALQGTCEDLSTSAYLVAVVGRDAPAWLLPLGVFLIAAGVAFATGTSWGTMGILIPAVGPLAYHLGGSTLMVMVLASVLDGAIFGDHCSPISDTTIMSSLSSQCDHIDHVRTQAPYALATMSVAATCGYLAVSLGMSNGLSLALGAGVIIALLLLVGRDPEKPLAVSGEAKA